MMTYTQKLKDPRWQKKRLEILERDSWTCQECEREDQPLHVHHHYYLKGKAPWDYHNSALQTLCEVCHEEKEAWLQEMRRELSRATPSKRQGPRPHPSIVSEVLSYGDIAEAALLPIWTLLCSSSLEGDIEEGFYRALRDGNNYDKAIQEAFRAGSESAFSCVGSIAFVLGPLLRDEVSDAWAEFKNEMTPENIDLDRADLTGELIPDGK